MAIDFFAKYDPLAEPADANYPLGSGKNETSPGLLDGSPFDKGWFNDWLGFFQKLVDNASITVSGNPDTVLASDYFDGMIFATSLNYNVLKDYEIGNIVIGNDGNLHWCYDPNGPSTTVKDPTTDVTGAWSTTPPSMAGKKVYLDFEPTANYLIRHRLLHNDGSSLADADYANLLSAYGGKIYGNADSTHFYLPDSQGLFKRNWDNGAGNDPDSASRTDRGDGTTGDNVGTKQLDQFKSHSHNVSGKTTTGGVDTARDGGSLPEGYNFPTSSDGGNETRPINQYHWEGTYY